MKEEKWLIPWKKTMKSQYGLGVRGRNKASLRNVGAIHKIQATPTDKPVYVPPKKKNPTI